MNRAARRLLLPTLLSGLCLTLTLQPEAGQSAPAPRGPGKNLTNSIKMKLVRIRAGKFLMGSPRDEPNRRVGEDQHQVEITRAFFLGIYHVTQAQYKKVMGSNPSYFSAGGSGSASVRGMNTSDFPVEGVDWDNALDFCKKLSALPGEKGARRVYRLPTEAEWEYACRAGTTTAYNTGKTLTAAQANFSGSSVGRVAKVGSYKPNAWGLYDMHGNVWHMVADWYDLNYYRVSPRKDPTGPATATLRVARGGSWGNPVSACRCATRAHVSRGQRNYIVGFRVACDVGGRAR
jgi:formylglycine-generating enzyme required for sulfatase activity